MGRLFWTTAIGLSILTVVAVAAVDYLPTNDGPEHVFIEFAGRRLDDAALGYGHFLEKGAALTGVGFDVLFGAFERLLPWRPALRVTLGVMALLWSWGAVALAASLGPRRAWLGLLGFATALQWTLYMGFFSFYLSSAVGLFVIALALHPSSRPGLRDFLLAALLFSQSIMHVFPALLSSAAIGAIGLITAPAGARLRAVGRLAIILAPTALVAWLTWVEGDPSNMAGAEHSFTLAATAVVAVRCFVSGPLWRAWPIVLFALAGLVCVAARRRWREERRETALAVVSLACLVAALVAPFDVRAWDFFSPRLVPFALLPLALMLPIERLRHRGLAAALVAAVVIYSCASNAWAWHYNRWLHEADRFALGALDAGIRRSGPRLVLVLDAASPTPIDPLARQVPFAAPNRALGSLLAVAHGGTPSGMFIGRRALHNLTWRAEPDRPRPTVPPDEDRFRARQAGQEPALRRLRIDRLLSYAPQYEDVIFLGRRTDHPLLRERGFVEDWSAAGLAIARFVGCPLQVEVPTAGASLAVTVEASWAIDMPPFFRSRLAPVIPAARRLLSIDGSPCGEVRLRVWFDADGSGGPSAADPPCAGADADRTLRVRAARDAPPVLCPPSSAVVPAVP